MNTQEKNIQVYVPKTFSNKVSYICSKIPNVEWCGILFYTVDSSIKSPETCKYTLQDILPMSKDSGGSTSYQTDDRVIDYLMADPKRLQWKQGDIHSHHNLGSFFSSIDYKDLQHQTDTSNVILSITVDNKNLYVGKVGMKARANVSEIVYIARDENGQKYELKKEQKVLETIEIFNCEFTFEDSKIEVDTDFQGYVDRIIKEAELKTSKFITHNNTTEFGSFQPRTHQTPLSQGNFNYSSKQMELPFSSVEDDDDLSMEEEILIGALTGRQPKFADTVDLSISDFVRSQKGLKQQIEFFNKNIKEILKTYTTVDAEQIELMEEIIEILKENMISAPYTIEQLIKNMFNLIQEKTNGR